MFPGDRRNAALAGVLRPARLKRLSDDIADQVRSLIAHGRLRPGDKLPGDYEMAAMMNISRSAVREALRRLEQTGLIRMRYGNGGGSYVAAPSSRAAAQAISDQYYLGGVYLTALVETRVWLESMIARLVAERGQLAHFNGLESEILIAERAHGAGTWAERPDAQVNFHMRLVAGTGNPLLEIIMEALLRISLEFTRPVNACRPSETIRFRRKLVRLLRAGDGDAAAAAITAYLTRMFGRCRDEVAERDQAEAQQSYQERLEREAERRRNREEDRERARREGWLPTTPDAAAGSDDAAAC